ncbi:K(+)/H(+) antiporter [Phlyctochytrium planicorne]|nr:K(+)/H(+) antiporter [Phlyctochytrium planicorne]
MSGLVEAIRQRDASAVLFQLLELKKVSGRKRPHLLVAPNTPPSPNDLALMEAIASLQDPIGFFMDTADLVTPQQCGDKVAGVGGGRKKEIGMFTAKVANTRRVVKAVAGLCCLAVSHVKGKPVPVEHILRFFSMDDSVDADVQEKKDGSSNKRKKDSRDGDEFYASPQKKLKLDPSLQPDKPPLTPSEILLTARMRLVNTFLKTTRNSPDTHTSPLVPFYMAFPLDLDFSGSELLRELQKIADPSKINAAFQDYLRILSLHGTFAESATLIRDGATRKLIQMEDAPDETKPSGPYVLKSSQIIEAIEKMEMADDMQSITDALSLKEPFEPEAEEPLIRLRKIFLDRLEGHCIDGWQNLKEQLVKIQRNDRSFENSTNSTPLSSLTRTSNHLCTLAFRWKFFRKDAELEAKYPSAASGCRRGKVFWLIQELFKNVSLFLLEESSATSDLKKFQLDVLAEAENSFELLELVLKSAKPEYASAFSQHIICTLLEEREKGSQDGRTLTALDWLIEEFSRRCNQIQFYQDATIFFRNSRSHTFGKNYYSLKAGHDLPVYDGGYDIEFVGTDEQLEKLSKLIRNQKDPLLEERGQVMIVALDSEWAPDNLELTGSPESKGSHASILQMGLEHASGKRYMYVLALSVLNVSTMEEMLGSLFNSKKIKKIGFSFEQDASKLRSQYKTIPDKLRYMKDLANIPANEIKKYQSDQSNGGIKPGGKMSLADLTRFVLRKRLSKSARISNWDRRPLRPQQLKYAGSALMVDHTDGAAPAANATTVEILKGFIATPHALDPDGIARLFVQILVILCVCRAISYPFKFIKQPAVIAEVIGGILMGPTALGRWGWFKNNVFPTQSLPTLNVLANFGVSFTDSGSIRMPELDLSVVAKRARTSLTISLTGISCTFLLSIGISKFFYTYFEGISDNVEYPKLLLFIGVAMSVTAFPVLARILTERKLLKTPVGITVISAAAVDDAAGWMALALVIALIQASSPLTGLYIFLTVIAFASFMFIVVRPLLSKLHRYFLALRTQNVNREDVSLSQPMVLVAFLLTFASAFFTSATGIHSIFGAFITGLVLPREDGFAVKLTEKLEELVTIVLLPLYFTYSGLKTNIGAINTGLSFAGFILVLIAASCGKIGGCTTAARFCGLNMRESLAVGVLMNTKGLVEIIILNIGLDAGLINDQVFAVMVLLAITTTCATTPLISIVYPESYYMKGAKDESEPERFLADEPKKLLLCLPTTGSVATMMRLVHKISDGKHKPDISQLFQSGHQHPVPPPYASNATISESAAAAIAKANASAAADMLSLHAVRLRPLTDRMSTLILAASEADGKSWAKDTSLMALRTFGLLRGVNVTPHVLLTQFRDYAKEISKLATETESDTIVVPWRMLIGADSAAAHTVAHASTFDDIRNQLTDSKNIGASSATHQKTDLLSSLFGVTTAGAAAALSSTQSAASSASSQLPSSAPTSPTTREAVKGDSEASAPAASYELEPWIGELASQLIRKARVKVAVLVDRTSDTNMLSDDEEEDEIVRQKASRGSTLSPVAEIAEDRPPASTLPRGPSSSHVAAPAVSPARPTSIVVPFFGGPDDRSALQLAMRLAGSSDGMVSVLHIRTLRPKSESTESEASTTGTILPDAGTRSSNDSRPNLLRHRRKLSIFGGATNNNASNNNNAAAEAADKEEEMLPPGFALDPIDVEDAKLLSFALGTDIATAPTNTHTTPVVVPSVSLNSTSDPTKNADSIETTAPEHNLNGGNSGEVPIFRTLTTTSERVSVEGSGPKAKVTITEVITVDPLGTCLEILRSKVINVGNIMTKPSLVVLGYFGPSWTGLDITGLPFDMNEHTIQGGTDAYRTQWTVNNATFQGGPSHLDTVASYASFSKAVAEQTTHEKKEQATASHGVEEKALGKVGAAIVRGGVGKWNMLVVRKIRINSKLKEL